MFLKKIEPNETVRFRVPGHVAQEFKKVRAESDLNPADQVNAS